MMLIRRIIFFLLTFTSLASFAQNPRIRFSENKNQWPENVLYRSPLYEGYLYAEKTGLTYYFYDNSTHSHVHPGFEEVNPVLTKPEDSIVLDVEHHEHKDACTTRNAHSYKVHFKGGNKNVKVLGVNIYPGIENYYIGKDPSKWANGVYVFEKIYYDEIFKKIDLQLYDYGGNLKYDFIVHPGAKAKDIQLTYSDVENLYIDLDGSLIVKTSVNQVIEQKPYAYQILDGQKVQVQCEYVLNDFTLSYEVGDYNKNFDLFIDPELVFSTYSGATSDNWGFTATYDHDNNAYSGGTVDGTGYPASSGAFSESFNGGGWDIGIIKYNPEGTERLYATFLGGDQYEMPHSLIVNSKNELLILGTTSSADFPTVNAYDDTFAGGDSVVYDNVFNFKDGVDIFIAKLSSSGANLLASTYIGGSKNDGLNFSWEKNLYYGHDSLYYNYGDGARGEIMVDSSDYVYVASTTFSDDFPMVNATQPTFGGMQDAVAFKLSPDLSNLEWSTYFGGSSKDAAYSIDVDANEGAFVTGGTCSDDNTMPSGGFMTTRAGGTVDAFVLKYNMSSGALENGSYFGSDSYDQAYFVRTNPSGNVFLFGQTTARGSELIYNAPYNKPNSGQFLASFTNDLSALNWSTVFGSGNSRVNISPTAFEVDICNRIYLAGSGRDWPTYTGRTLYDPVNKYYYVDFGWDALQGTKNMDITPDAFQPKTDGQDFYIMVIDDEAKDIDYATYLGELNNYKYYTYDFITTHQEGCRGSGGDHVDGGTSRFDSRGYVYQSVCASCSGCQSFPIKPNPGAWSTINNSTNCNNAVIRFFIDFGLLIADFELPEVSCESVELEFENTTQILYTNPQIKYTWDFGDGSPMSHEETPSHSYSEPGTYLITLYVEDFSACNLADTISKELTIVYDTHTETLEGAVICEGDTVTIGLPNEIDPDLTYEWSPKIGLSDPNKPLTEAFPNESTAYTLTVSKGWCQTIYEVNVKVHPNYYEITSIDVEVSGVSKNPVCLGDEMTLTARTTDEAARFIWSNSPTFRPALNTDFRDSSITITPTSTATYYVLSNSKYCNFADTAKITVNVSPNLIKATGEDTICVGGSVKLNVENLLAENTLKYTWEPRDFVTSGQGTISVTVKPPTTTDFIIYAENAEGCVAHDTLTINVDELIIDTTVFNQISCFGKTDGSITVKPIGYPPYVFSWENGATDSARTNLGSGTYTFTVSDSLGCTNSKEFEIIEPELLQITDTTLSFITCLGACNGSIVPYIAGGTTPYSYKWSHGETSKDVENLCAGYYNLVVTDANGCKATLPENITIGLHEKLPYLNPFAKPKDVFIGQTAILHASEKPNEKTEYTWSPLLWIDSQKGATVKATPEMNMIYYVHAKDEYGCESQDTLHINAYDWECSETYIYVPTAFSPNNDKTNDIFKVESRVVTELKLEVFDRWGEKVFETTDVDKTWDGTYKGKPLAPQVLVFYLFARCLNEQEFTQQGNITIIK